MYYCTLLRSIEVSLAAIPSIKYIAILIYLFFSDLEYR